MVHERFPEDVVREAFKADEIACALEVPRRDGVSSGGRDARGCGDATCRGCDMTETPMTMANVHAAMSAAQPMADTRMDDNDFDGLKYFDD
jgi:hypothetical protein